MELVQCIICVSAASVHLRRRRSAWSVVRLCHHDIHRILRVLRRSHHSHRHQTIFVLLAMSRCHFVRLKNATFSHRLKMVNGSRYYTALESVSWHQLYLALLPFSHARSESINADSLNSNFLQLGRRSGGRPQRTVYPRRLPVNCDTHYFSRLRSHDLPIVSPAR